MKLKWRSFVINKMEEKETRYKCDECGREMTEAEYNRNKGLCVVCGDMIQ